MKKLPRTVREILTAGEKYLLEKGVESPTVIMQLLLSHVLGCKKLEIYEHSNDILSEKDIGFLRKAVLRVTQGEPIQYIIENVEFYGYTFKIDRRAFIPRPETETLVDIVLKCSQLWEIEHPIILDIGTGCGCIAIVIAMERPNSFVIATDINKEALQLARENIELYSLTERVIITDKNLSDFIEPESVDAIVSNPPYVPTSLYEKLPKNVKDYEPRLALDGGKDGLRIIEEIINDAIIVLKQDGYIFLEIAEYNIEPVKRLLEINGFKKIELFKDLHGHERVIKAVLT